MIDLLIVVAFAAYAIGSGLRSRHLAGRNLQEYFLAGKSVSGWRSGCSMAATQFAADTPLLVSGLVATAGIFALWRLWIYGLAFLLLAFVFATGWRRGGVLTDAELTQVRYSGRAVPLLRFLKAVYYGTVINCVVLAMVLVAAIRIAEVFLPWHQWLPEGVYGAALAAVQGIGLELGNSVTGLPQDVATTNNLISILLILLFTAAYSTTGGLRSVIATDVVQFALAMIGTAVYAWVVVDAAGGFGHLTERVVDLYGDAEADRMLSFGPDMAGGLLLPFLVLIGLQWLFQMNSDGTGYLAQRSMACRTDRDARTAGVLFAWAQVFLRSLFWLAIAVGLLVLYPFTPEQAGSPEFAASREILFVTGIEDYLPPGVRGLMLTGLLAALASTVDTHLNWGASYWSNDVYHGLVCRRWLKREPRDRELVVVARLSNVGILVIALVVMANLGSIQAAWFISLLFGAGMGAVLVLRWLWNRITLWSELAAMVASLITAPVLLLTLGMDAENEWLRLSIMAGVTTAAAIGVTFVTPRTDPDVLLDFYRQVRPYGFWRREAALSGEDPGEPVRLLAQRVRAVGATALSLFLLLVGVGRLIVAPPGASALMTWGMIAGGLALVPVWWRYLTGEDLRFRQPAAGDAPAE
ncbi:sodium:solute symporter family protein [Caenispirillum bisanense]|uniref:sodium:solute symporter family protein n=1 Tax=Caenispirillum bisanense TaxID=414052 RepID=UPI0031D699CF